MKLGVSLRGLRALGFVLLSLCVPAHAAPSASEVLVAPVPDWVIEAPMPAPRESRSKQVQYGIYDLILDTQVKLEGDHYFYYERMAQQVTDRSGLESAARLTFQFEPLSDTFYVHRVRLWRGGTASEITPDFHISRREPDLDNGVVDGTLTAYAELPGVRVGDIVDYEVSWRTAPALWPGEFFARVNVEWSVPQEFLRYRLLTPAGRSLSILDNKTELKPLFTHRGDYDERIWTITDSEPKPGEESVPDDFPQWGFVSLSTMSSWKDVSAWAMKIFDVENAARAPLEPAKTIAAEGGSDTEQITRAVRFVQDNIRYVGDEVGLGSHVPRKPQDVLRLGYGDCKDKSLLLVALLRQLGVEAYPALTSLYDGPLLNRLAPSPGAFDHVIVKILWLGNSYWVDATQTHQGGVFPNLAQPNYGYTLPIREGTESLEPIHIDAKADRNLSVDERFDLTEYKANGIKLIVRSRYEGGDADDFRGRLANQSLDRLSRNYVDYYEEVYPALEPQEDLNVEDDRDANTIAVTETYRIPISAIDDDLLQNFALRASELWDALPIVTAGARKAPVAIDFPARMSHSITIAHAGTPLLGPDDYSSSKAYAAFSIKSRSANDELTIVYDLQTLASSVPADQVGDYLKIAREIDDTSNLVIDLTEGPFELSESKLTTALGAAVLVLLGAFWLGGAILALRADAKFAGRTVFHPVAMTKFLTLSLLTLGAYAYLWVWRCWRWNSRNDPGDGIPSFIRMIFFIFNYYSLFSRIRARQEMMTPVWQGVALTTVYVVWVLGTRLVNRFSATAGPVSVVIGLLSFLAIAPLVAMVNGLNRENTDAMAYNSRWNARAFIAAICGAAFVVLVALGLTAGG